MDLIIIREQYEERLQTELSAKDLINILINLQSDGVPEELNKVLGSYFGKKQKLIEVAFSLNNGNFMESDS
ncbi:MAG: hypothetical protein GY834_02235 [Bacteroidetes bacterium]|nr:hypothetical protein [Bacteroidota bacterium]